jgi:hypothetical protein
MYVFIVGQQNGKGGSSADTAVDKDSPVMGLDYPVDRSKSQPCSSRLCGKKRLKDFVHVSTGHPTACILYFNLDDIAQFHARFCSADLLSPDMYHSPSRHGFSRIDEKIPEYLPQLVMICIDDQLLETVALNDNFRETRVASQQGYEIGK